MTEYVVVRDCKLHGKQYKTGDKYDWLGGEYEHKELRLIPRYIRPLQEGEVQMNEREKRAVERKAKKEEFAPTADAMIEKYGEKLTELLKAHGYRTVSEVDGADNDELLAIKGIGKQTLKEIRK